MLAIGMDFYLYNSKIDLLLAALPFVFVNDPSRCIAIVCKPICDSFEERINQSGCPFLFQRHMQDERS